MSGKGISESVRNHVSTWVDDGLMDLIYPEYQKTGGKVLKGDLKLRMKRSEDWKRDNRKKCANGYNREYHSDSITGGKSGKIKLIVHSPTSDYSADSYVFMVDGKAVAGGKTKLKSVLYSKAVQDKKVETESFVKFTPAELQQIEAKMIYGDGLDSLFTSRED